MASKSFEPTRYAGLAAGALAAGPLRSLAAGAPPALGAGIPISEARGSMVVDIGIARV